MMNEFGIAKATWTAVGDQRGDAIDVQVRYLTKDLKHCMPIA